MSSAISTIASAISQQGVPATTNLCLHLTKPCGYTLIIHSIPEVYDSAAARPTLTTLGSIWVHFKPTSNCEHPSRLEEATAKVCSTDEDVGEQAGRCCLESQSYKDYLSEAGRDLVRGNTTSAQQFTGELGQAAFDLMEQERRKYQNP